MELKKLTHTETLEHSLSEYNITEWRKTVNRFNSYTECKFYEWIDTPNKYATIFAVYIADGIRFMTEVSYSSCLSNTGFTRFVIDDDGNTREIPFKGEDGKKGRLDNSKDSRIYMREITEMTKWIFTTCWVG
jgi:hypothetical protein